MKKCKILVALMVFVGTLFLSAGAAPATADPIDYWGLTYVANAPASINMQSQALMICTSNNGYVAKASTLSGSYDRNVKVYGREGCVINNTNHYIMITAPNTLTSVFYVTGAGTEAYFRASAYGESTCYSNGFVSTNNPNIYNSGK